MLAAFELTDYDDQDFDLRTKLLPESHRALLNILVRMVKHYSSLPPEPISDHLEGHVIPIDYFEYLHREKKELLQKLLELDAELNDEYYTFRHPGRKKPDPLLSITAQPDKVPIHPRKRVHPGWLAAAMNLDCSWFKLAGQLNNARNAAAHSVDAKRIGACFGIKGPDALEKIRGKCLDALSTLLAVKNSNKVSA